MEVEEEEEFNGLSEDEMVEEVDEEAQAGAEVMETDEPEVPEFFHDEEMDVKAKERNAKPGSKRNPKGKVALLIRSKVERVLEKTKLTKTRARMCDEGDFLKLLWEFNNEGIHFS